MDLTFPFAITFGGTLLGLICFLWARCENKNKDRYILDLEEHSDEMHRQYLRLETMFKDHQKESWKTICELMDKVLVVQAARESEDPTALAGFARTLSSRMRDAAKSVSEKNPHEEPPAVVLPDAQELMTDKSDPSMGGE